MANYEVDDLIIDMIRGQPILYDKSFDEYHTEYRGQRIEILNSISQAIYQIFQINMSGIQ